MTAQLLDQVGAPGDDPGLRSAKQLVAGEADEIGAGRERGCGRRLAFDVDERAGAEVVEERQPVPLRDRRQLLQARLLREADDPEVRLVNAEQEGGLRTHR